MNNAIAYCGKQSKNIDEGRHERGKYVLNFQGTKRETEDSTEPTFGRLFPTCKWMRAG
jgi:hypothetical protein